MVRNILYGVAFSLLLSILISGGSGDLTSWTKQDILHKFYFSAPTANPIRCEKLGERQAECVTVTFDVSKRVCFLHRTNVSTDPNSRNGKYMVRTIRNVTNKEDTTSTCDDQKLKVPSAARTEDKYLNIKPQDCEESTSTSSDTTSTAADTTRASESTTAWETTSTPESTTVAETTSVPGSTTAAETTTQSGLTTVPETTTTEQVNPCKNNQAYNGANCVCQAPLTGQYCENGPRDCRDYGGRGWHDVYPEDGIGAVRVYCWSTCLAAFVAPQDGFALHHSNATWEAFKHGFGDIQISEYVTTAYWLGNKNIHRITNGSATYYLEYELTDTADKIFTGKYSSFSIDDESLNYTAHYSVYTSSNEMGQTLSNGSPFRTFDKNDNGCVSQIKCAFWYGSVCEDTSPLLGSLLFTNGLMRQYAEFWACLYHTN